VNINKTTVSSNCGYVKASVEATLIVAYKLAQEWQNSQLVSPSNIQNSSNNDGLEFYNAGQYFESDCMGNSSNIKNMHKTIHAMSQARDQIFQALSLVFWRGSLV